MTTARDRPPEEAAEDTSLARGLRVLLMVADRGAIRADELATLLDTPLSTIYRYLRTLAGFGFVDRRGSTYRLGPRLVIGSGAVVTSESLIRMADPILQRLVEETGETAFISRRVGSAAVCLHAVASGHALRVTVEPGTATPLDVGAVPKVLLAHAPPEILEEVMADRTGREDGLRSDLDLIIDTGVAHSDDEPIPGSVTVAVPVLRADGIIAALAVIGPAARCGSAWRTRVGRLLTEAATAISGALETDTTDTTD